MPQCTICKKELNFTNSDKEFFTKMGVPVPDVCFNCNMQKVLAWRNENVLYPNKCNLCGKDVISTLRPDSEYRVHCQACHTSDDWEPLDYGVDYQEGKSFFEQFKNLFKKVPHRCLRQIESVNCDYCNTGGYNKNCYIISDAAYNEDCYYSSGLMHTNDCVDCADVDTSELCYQCVSGRKLYHCLYCHKCQGCNYCNHCYNCVNCSHCSYSTNLRHKKYVLFNQQYSEEEYKQRVEELDKEEADKKYQEILAKTIRPYAFITNAPNCSGDDLDNCRDCRNCFYMKESENVAWAENYNHCQDARVVYGSVGSQLYYLGSSCGKDSYHILCSFQITRSKNCAYCYQCEGCSDCLGCAGLRKKKYCILNKQYSEKEYFALSDKIKAEMLKNGEWGRMFDNSLSPWGYNETRAQDEFLLTEEEAIKQGWKWQDDLPGTFGQQATKEILACVDCAKNYKLIPQELDFYSKMGIKIPHQCPECRRKQRWQLRGPRQLWHRQCMKEGCSNEFETTYAPERPEIVYCEDCYRKEIY